jgi:hypothetical protein
LLYQQFAKLKKYKPRYIIADKAYDTEPIRKCINEEAKAFDQIPLKKKSKKKDITDLIAQQFSDQKYMQKETT